MSEYSVEEVRTRAAIYAEINVPETQEMLTAYADLREQIERAREGVTDEVVESACDVAERMGFIASNNSLRRVAMKAAIQFVAHLLPSGERGGVGADTTLRQAARVDEKTQLSALAVIYGRGYRNGHESTVEGGYVDVVHYERATYWQDTVREMLAEDDELEAALAQPAQVAGVECPACKGVTYITRVSGLEKCWKCDGAGTIVEPVAQGEAVGEIVPMYEPVCSTVVLFNSDLPIGTRLYTVQPHASPEQPATHSEFMQLANRVSGEFDKIDKLLEQLAGRQAEAVAYFSADPHEGDFRTHKTLAKAHADAEKMLEFARDAASDDGWEDEPPHICYGVVLGGCVEKEGYRRPAPEGSEFTELVDYRLTDPAHTAAPVGVPDGWRELIEWCATTAGTEVNGNQLSAKAKQLLAAAPSAPQEKKACTRNCDCVGPCKMGVE